jgi:methyl-accepting chemotaxis protein
VNAAAASREHVAASVTLVEGAREAFERIAADTGAVQEALATVVTVAEQTTAASQEPAAQAEEAGASAEQFAGTAARLDAVSGVFRLQGRRVQMVDSTRSRGLWSHTV